MNHEFIPYLMGATTEKEANTSSKIKMTMAILNLT